jgi:MscS family membrane protein
VVRVGVLCAFLLAFFSSHLWAQGTDDWSGHWDTYWRDGAARMLLQQQGATVSGTYEPGEGRIEGRIEGRVLRGSWFQDDTSGTVLFALSEDGHSFTGRFVDGEYWNGKRVSDVAATRLADVIRDTPRAAFRSLVYLENEAVYEGNISAVNAADSLLLYVGQPSDARDERRRRRLLWTLLDLSTFRIYDAPRRVDGEATEFSIGPAAGNFEYSIQLRKIGDEWFVVVPPASDLRRAVDDMVAALGHDTLSQLKEATANSPRAAMRDFLQGTRNWHTGGRERALAALDLSFLPPRLYSFEAPLLAEYLKQVIDRAGYVTWQEISDNPNRAGAYVYYRHPAGSVVIEQVPGPEGEPTRWKFSAETLRNAPQLFAQMQDLPVAAGISPSEPITRFFQIRESIRAGIPGLLLRSGPLELWQWLVIPLSIVFAVVFGWLTGKGVSLALSRGLRRAEHGLRVGAARRLGRPTAILVGAGSAVLVFTWAGLAETVLGAVTVALAATAATALGWLLYTAVELAGGYFQRRAKRTSGFVDEIAVSLVTGVLKIGIVAAGIIAIADITGIPYEGVIAGLGVGGIALAFAARDTVSNLIGGAILMSDRPFRRGDLIETEGQMATVETVGLRSTRMRTFDDSLLVLPNSQLTDKSIVNWGQRRKRKVRLEISLRYETPRDRLDAFVTRLRAVYLAQPAADATTGYVGLRSFGESALTIELWGYFNLANYDGYIAARHQLIGDIVDLARSLEVDFAYPTRAIRLLSEEDGNTEDEQKASNPA